MFRAMPDLLASVRSTERGKFRRPWGYLYIGAYWAGMIWFAYWCVRTAADRVQYEAAVPYIITALAPCAILATLRRIITGGWI